MPIEPEGLPSFVSTVRTNVEDAVWMTFETFDAAVWPRDSIEWCYLVSPEVTGSNEFEMGLCRLPPGGVHLRHHHPARSELYYVTAGTAELTIGDRRFRAEPQDAYYIPRRATHGFVNDGDEPFELVFCYDVPPNLRRPDTVWDE